MAPNVPTAITRPESLARQVQAGSDSWVSIATFMFAASAWRFLLEYNNSLFAVSFLTGIIIVLSFHWRVVQYAPKVYVRHRQVLNFAVRALFCIPVFAPYMNGTEARLKRTPSQIKNSFERKVFFVLSVKPIVSNPSHRLPRCKRF